MIKLDAVPNISICLCTYKRPELLVDCLNSLLNLNSSLSFEIIVTDNDATCSGKHAFDRIEVRFSEKGIPVFYQVEPIQNIALARNRCVRAARGEFVAFIDDDEIAAPQWLVNLHETLIETDADGVWGPVIPIIPESFPEWMRNSRLFDYKNPQDGSLLADYDFKTGNAMIKRSQLAQREGPFCDELGRTGGSDSELFSWLRRKGSKFFWASKAEVYEHIEEKRRFLRWHLIRGYRGGWGYSYRLVRQRGWVVGFCTSLGRIIPSILRSLFCLVMDLNNPRAAALVMAGELSGHLGKIGYFFNKKIEEYK